MSSSVYLKKLLTVVRNITRKVRLRFLFECCSLK